MALTTSRVRGRQEHADEEARRNDMADEGAEQRVEVGRARRVVESFEVVYGVQQVVKKV